MHQASDAQGGQGAADMRARALAHSLREVAARARLTGAFEGEAPGAHLTLFLELGPVPAPLAGLRLRLCLGDVALMAVPLRASHAPVEYGPVRLTLEEALRHAGHPPRLLVEGAPTVAPGKVVGAPLEAMAIDSEAAFFEKVQLHHSRYTDPLLLRLGARAAWRRLPDFAPRAAALTILAHRILERDFRHLTEQDHAEASWLRAEGRRVVQEGLDTLAAGKPHWTVVRWTTSLATVCALLSLCQDDPEAAIFFFGAAAAQVPLVHVAPVAALNLVNACLLQGVLLALTGRREAARPVLEGGVRAFQPCVAAQDAMANVWVIGDMINVGRAARMCFVALDRFGLLETKGPPRIHPGTPLELGQIPLPFMKILAAGLCPSIATALAALDAPASSPGPAP